MNLTAGNSTSGIIAVSRVLLCSALLMTATAAIAAEPKLVEVEVGTHHLLREAAAVRRVAVGDPTIADVNVINGREILVTGKSLGVTSLLLWPQSGPTREYRIRVGAVKDPTRASKPDAELAGATVEKGSGVDGKLPNLLAHRRAAQGAQNVKGGITDTSVVEGDMQVMTEIKIAEVSRTTAQQYGLGLNYSRNGSKSTINFQPPATPASVLNSAFNLVFSRDIGNNQSIGGVLNLLESRGLARVLAEPSLVASSGQTASFLAGGEFPVPVSQGGGTTSGAAITVEYKEFGVRLNLTPTVLSKDRISLKVAPEVSDLDFSAGIQIGGVAVPALNVRRTDTTVELGDGESFVISGLVSNNLQANVSKLPWLGNVPILGAFFKNTSNDRTERELIMVVTPHLVRPLARGAALPRLPGEKYDNYRPGFTGLMLEEKGDFDTSQYGFSR